MFATTKQFLDYFNLKSLQDLPPLSEIKELVGTETEFDLNEELAQSRILDLPNEASNEESRALTAAEEAELIAEEEAAELAKKPLDEILRMGVPEELLEREESADQDAEPEEEDDLNMGLTDDDLVANEEFEKVLRQNDREESVEEQAEESVEDENPEQESNVIPLHGNKNSAEGDEITEFEIADVNDLDAPLGDQAERIDESTAEIDYVIEDTHLAGNYADDTGEINVIGDETDNIK